MQRVGLVMKRGEMQAVQLGEEMCRILRECGKEVLLEPAYEQLARNVGASTSENIADDTDLLVVLGGDGTILRAAGLLNAKSIPVLGINLGRVGFMAEVGPQEAINELKAAMDGTASLVERMLIQISLPDGRTVRVLNELVIHWAGLAKLIDLGIKVGDSKEIEVRADGLIVSTPIGSSAYSYAAQGPLVHPDVECIVLTPVCPYAGLKRPLIIPAYMQTTLMLKRGDDFNVTLDGRTALRLEEGQTLGIVKSPMPFLMVKSRARDYFDVLETKLGMI